MSDPILTADITKLELSDGRFLVDILEGTLTGKFVDTYDGAPTLSLTLRDYAKTLITHPLIVDYKKPGREVDIRITDVNSPGANEVFYRLLQVKKAGRTLNLTFEDRSVALLRTVGRSTGRVFTRGAYTRLQAGVALIRLVKSPRVRIVAPELNRIQPIAARKLTENEKDAQRGPGFVANGGVTVKKVDADREQLKVIAAILDVGIQMKAKRTVLISAVMATTQEATARNLAGGDRDSVGPFQIREMHIPRGEKDRRRDLQWAATWYLSRAIRIYRQSPSIKPGDLAQQVERSAHPKAYEAWLEEATATVDAYLGRETVSSAKTAARVAKKYTLVKEPDTTIWDTLGSWFNEVKFRRFAVANVIYLISDEGLLASRPRMRISEDTDGVEEITWDVDGGKEVDKATVKCHAESWVAPAGTVVELYDEGPGDGRWIVSTRERSIWGTDVTISLTRPATPLPEPAAATESAAASEKTDITLLDEAYALAKEIDSKNWVYVWGGGHAKAGVPGSSSQGTGYDCSGLVSAILKEIGATTNPLDTVGIGRVGKPGKGRHLTIYVKPYSGAAGHTYIVFQLPGKPEQRFEAHGPRGSRIGFQTSRGTDAGYQARHIEGL